MSEFTIVVGRHAASSVAGSTTAYTSLIGLIDLYTSNEDRCSIEVNDDYTLSSIALNVVVNEITGGASTLRSRVNLADGNIIISVPASESGWHSDEDHTDVMDSGDKFALRLTTGADGSNYFSICSISSKLIGSYPIIASTYFFDVTSGTYYIPVAGSMMNCHTDESYCKYTFRTATTLSHFTLKSNGNACSTASTCRTRKNGGDGNQSVSVPAFESGRYEDSDHTDTIDVGDQVNYAITASSSIELEHCAIKSSSKVNLLVESYCVGRSITPPFTSYMPMEGILATTPYPYEDWQQSYFFSSCTLRNMYVYVNSNSDNASTTIITRVNTADGNISVSIPTTETGAYEDIFTVTNHSDSIDAGDKVCYKISSAGTTGSIWLTYVGVEEFFGGAENAIIKIVGQWFRDW